MPINFVDLCIKCDNGTIESKYLIVIQYDRLFLIQVYILKSFSLSCVYSVLSTTLLLSEDVLMQIEQMLDFYSWHISGPTVVLQKSQKRKSQREAGG